MPLKHDGLSLSFGVREELRGARVAKVAQGFFLLDVAVGVLSWVATGAAVEMRR